MFTMLKMLKNSDRNWTLTSSLPDLRFPIGVSFTSEMSKS